MYPLGRKYLPQPAGATPVHFPFHHLFAPHVDVVGGNLVGRIGTPTLQYHELVLEREYAQSADVSFSSDG
jgi:hypothetical protein